MICDSAIMEPVKQWDILILLFVNSGSGVCFERGALWDPGIDRDSILRIS